MSGLGLRVHRTAQNLLSVGDLDRWVFGRYREFLVLELIVANAQSPFDWKSRHHGAIARIFASLLKRNFVENRRFLFEIELFFELRFSCIGRRLSWRRRWCRTSTAQRSPQTRCDEEDKPEVGTFLGSHEPGNAHLNSEGGSISRADLTG